MWNDKKIKFLTLVDENKNKICSLSVPTGTRSTEIMRQMRISALAMNGDLG